MKYCSHCGNELIGNIKFCPACGSNTEVLKSKVEKPLMYKRESKSLKENVIDFGKKTLQNDVGKRIQDKTTNYVKSKVEETLSSNASKEKQTIKNISETQTIENKTSSINKSVSKWTWIYIIINVLLVYFGNQSEEVMGVLIFSILILGIVFFRRKKEKPYNWLVKIIMIIQLVLLVALVAESIEYMSFLTLLFVGLLLSNILLLFKGNNS
jgi:hypothetical protein